MFIIRIQARLRWLFLLLASSALMFGQVEGAHSSAAGAKPGQSGAATGQVAPAMKDAQSRPITAGGYVDNAPVVYEDITAKSGLKIFQHVSGGPEKKLILEAPGSGVALLDYDNDGWQDIYLVNGSTFEALRGKQPAGKSALFHNNHDGTFTDVTAKAGVANERWGFGAAVGDFDNDGWPDLYVSNFGKNRLYHNNHDGTFTDVAERAGVTLGGWSTGVTFGDYDGDGKLDLFVAGYVQFDLNNPPMAGAGGVAFNFCQYRGAPVMCGPRGLKGERDHLFHNNGDGTFTDVSEKAGVADTSGYYGFAAAFVDLNGDGKLDLLVANDSTPNYFYLNKGDETFEDESYASGFALNENGREQASMGMAIADYRNDGRLALYVTNFSDDYNTLYKDDGDGNYTDVSFQSGLADLTVPFLGWGTAFLDYDNDGWKDLIVSNGHVYPGVDKNDWGTTFAQRALLFHNKGNDKFEPIPAATGSGLAEPVVGRGLAVGDLFNDGKLAVVINNLDGPPLVLRDVAKNENNWVELRLIGGEKAPHDAVGARVYLKANGVTQRCDVVSGGSYNSSSDMRVHFGLGASKQIDSAEVAWPDGTKEPVRLAGVNKIYAVQEGKGVVEDKPAVSKSAPAKRPTAKKAAPRKKK